MTRLDKHVPDFLNRTKTTFSNDKSIYMRTDGQEKQLMFEKMLGESQYSDLQYETDLTFPSSIFSPNKELPPNKSLTWGAYNQLQSEPKIVESEVKSKFKPPVYVEEDTIKISSRQLEILKPYFIRLKDTRYMIIKPEEKIIDFYELPD